MKKYFQLKNAQIVRLSKQKLALKRLWKSKRRNKGKLFPFQHNSIWSKKVNGFFGVSSFECTNYVFNTTNENNSFSITLPGDWKSESAEKNIDKLRELLELNNRDWSLHIAAVREKGHKIHIGGDEYDISDLDSSPSRVKTIDKFKKVNILGSPTCLQMRMRV